jgi:hypothetical protein
MQTLYITIERERDSRSSRDGARFRVKVATQPGAPKLLMSTNLRQSVTQARSEAETLFGTLDWSGQPNADDPGIRDSAILEID